MNRYSMTQYLYDCYRLTLLRLELEYLMTINSTATWWRERVTLLTEEMTRIDLRVTQYEQQPRNSGTTAESNYSTNGANENEQA